MHVPRRLAFAIAAIVTALLAFTPGVAQAAPIGGYYQQIATALHNEPVFVDSNASPSITQAQALQLDNQIKATHKPIYVVLVDSNQAHTVASSPSQFLAGLHAALGNGTSEVIGLSTSKGFYANGYDEPGAIANGAGTLARQTMDQYRSDGPMAVYTNWVTAVSGLAATSGSGPTALPQTNSAATSKHGTPTWVIILIILGGLAVIIFIIAMLMRRNRRRQTVANEKKHANRVSREIDSLTTSLLEMTNQVTLHPDAQSDYDQAMQDVQLATQAASEGDPGDAERYINSAKRHYARAQSRINGVDPDAHHAATSRNYQYDDDGVPTRPAATSGSGGYSGRPAGVTINNTTYAPQSNMSSGYPHYFGGGYYGGSYFGPGYYADPFWTWVVMDSLLDADRDRSYGDGYRDAERDDRTDTGSTGGDSWGNQQDNGWNTSDVPAGSTDGDSWGNLGSGGDSGWGGSDNSSW